MSSSSSSKSKVTSVRLTLEALQSCFDLCELLDVPTVGASAAITRSIETLTRDLRAKKTIPTYRPSELALLLKEHLAKRNPTSMLSLEALGNSSRSVDFDPSPFADTTLGRSSIGQRDFESQYTIDAGRQPAPDNSISEQKDQSWQELEDERNEYKDLVEEQILDQIKKEEEDLLSKILITG